MLRQFFQEDRRVVEATSSLQLDQLDNFPRDSSLREPSKFPRDLFPRTFQGRLRDTWKDL